MSERQGISRGTRSCCPAKCFAASSTACGQPGPSTASTFSRSGSPSARARGLSRGGSPRRRSPRRCLRDEGRHLWRNHADESFYWRINHGCAGYDVVGHFTIEFESEAAYLKRLGLLTAADHRAISPEDFEPEAFMVDSPTLDEIQARRRAINA